MSAAKKKKKRRKKPAPPPPVVLRLDPATAELMRHLSRQISLLNNVCWNLVGVLSEVNDAPKLLAEIAKLRGMPGDVKIAKFRPDPSTAIEEPPPP